MRASADEVIIMTDDGSYGKQGLVTNGAEEVIRREKVDMCVTIGPAIMMKFVSLLTKKYEIPTVVSLNTMNYKGKNKSRYTKSGLIQGKTASYKKALVTLKEGDTIDFFSNI
jgi:NAD(P)H-flavin reductase